MKKLIFVFGLLCALIVTAQAQNTGKAYVEIQTSAVCGSCKAIIEKAVTEIEGVKLADLDLETSILSVKYDAEKTNPEAIRLAITASGYSADTLPPVKEAYDKLDPCCKSTDHD